MKYFDEHGRLQHTDDMNEIIEHFSFKDVQKQARKAYNNVTKGASSAINNMSKATGNAIDDAKKAVNGAVKKVRRWGYTNGVPNGKRMAKGLKKSAGDFHRKLRKSLGKKRSIKPNYDFNKLPVKAKYINGVKVASDQQKQFIKKAGKEFDKFQRKTSASIRDGVKATRDQFNRFTTKREGFDKVKDIASDTFTDVKRLGSNFVDDAKDRLNDHKNKGFVGKGREFIEDGQKEYRKIKRNARGTYDKFNNGGGDSSLVTAINREMKKSKRRRR